jgi:hypothetical protein
LSDVRYINIYPIGDRYESLVREVFEKWKY